MSVLYYWRRDHYVDEVAELRQTGLALEQDSPAMGALRPGDYVWAFTRRADGTYVLAARTEVERVESSTEHEFGEFLAVPVPGTSVFYDLDAGEDFEPVIRALGVRADAAVLGQSFQGRSAVRPISSSDEVRLFSFSEHLPRLDTEENADGLDRLSLADLEALARYRAVAPPAGGPPEQRRRQLIADLRALPEPAGLRSAFAGKRVVRAPRFRAGGNPRQLNSHGHNAYNLIPLGDFGIRAEDLLARVKQLPAKSSPAYGAGGTNHIRWDLDHEYVELIDDPGPPVVVAGLSGAKPAGRGGSVGRPPDLDRSPLPPERVDVHGTRIVRDSRLVRWLKDLHQDRCQICGLAVAGENGWTYSEGHHLKPLGGSHNGPDIAANVLIVCPNHHALCDFGAIKLELRTLRLHPEHEIAEEYILYHNQLYRDS